MPLSLVNSLRYPWRESILWMFVFPLSAGIPERISYLWLLFTGLSSGSACRCLSRSLQVEAGFILNTRYKHKRGCVHYIDASSCSFIRTSSSRRYFTDLLIYYFSININPTPACSSVTDYLDRYPHGNCMIILFC